MMEKLDYLNYNPVRADLVEYPKDYIYSARAYAGETGLVKVEVV